MAAVRVPAPPFTAALLDGTHLAQVWQVFISALYQAVYGEGFDKVDASYRTAAAAAPAARQVVAVGGLHAGGALTGNVPVALYAATASVAALPAAATEGDWAYAINGRKPGQGAGAGTGVPVFWSAGAWIAVTSGVAVTA